MMHKHNTACGGTIVIPPKAQAHLQAHPEVLRHLSAAIATIRLPASGFMRAEADMRVSVGREGCVATEPLHLDAVGTFSLRLGRDMPSRIAPLGTVGPETTIISVLAFPSRSAPREYVCATAWVGRLAEKEPWDPQIRDDDERQKCMQFWTTHALVHDPEVMGEPFESTWRKVLSA